MVAFCISSGRPLPGGVDRNICTRRWYEAIRKKATFSAVAEREQTTTSRIQQMIGLAFLAPDIVGKIAAGTQPMTFTSEWFKTRQLPVDWDEQRRLVSGL